MTSKFNRHNLEMVLDKAPTILTEVICVTSCHSCSRPIFWPKPCGKSPYELLSGSFSHNLCSVLGMKDWVSCLWKGYNLVYLCIFWHENRIMNLIHLLVVFWWICVKFFDFFFQTFQQQPFYPSMIQPWTTSPYYDIGTVFSVNGLAPQGSFSKPPSSRYIPRR